MKYSKKTSGFASVAIVVFMAICITVTSAAVAIILTNSLAGSKFEQGVSTYDLAESGLENGVLRFLRDPNNYIGETMVFDQGTANIIVATDKKSISSTAKSGNFVRTVEAQVDYSSNLKINSWQEK